MNNKPAIVRKAISADKELAEHLKRAEEALISAVELFVGKTGSNPPDRTEKYLKRLTMAQETVTTLLREELVRIRGPVKMTFKKRMKNVRG